jgi:PAS domain S-box-containing protein
VKAHDAAELAQTLFEEIGDAAFIADPVTLRLVDVNPMAQRLTRVPRAELLRLSLDQLFRSDNDKGLGHLQRALQTTQTFHSQEGYFLRRGDDNWAPVNLTLTRLHTEHSQLGLVLARDVTERVRAEERLRLANATLERRVQERTAELARVNEALRNNISERVRAEQKFRNVLESAPDAMVLVNADGRMALVNHRTETMFRYRREDLLGQPVEMLMPERYRGQHVENRGGFAANPRVRRMGAGLELYGLRSDGSEFPVEISLSPLETEEGPLTVCAIRDVSESKLLEEQFRQAQKMEAIGRLAGGVAHDFNNLLTIINGYGALMLARLASDDPNKELIQQVINAGERAAGLTRQLLAFSRKAVIVPQALDLRDVVANVERMLRRIVGEDVQLTVATDPEAGIVKADPSQIEQVILNLVVNARDAMPSGGRLAIEVRNVELDEAYSRSRPDVRPGPYVMLAVTDTGCGMDQATMARAFEPFFTTKGELGTGLGLATVHGIATQSGGHVRVHSELGRGAAFEVYLPRINVQPPASPSSAGLAVLPRGSETVLIAEDEDGVRGFTRYVLETCGYTVIEARDGAEALQLAEKHDGPLPLLVTDVVMPRMGGREAAERIHAVRPGIKVMYLSGYTDDAVVRHGILKAETAFLQKPFSPAALARKVRELLDSKAG